ncbi:hypothetical protein AMECASPLE_023947 [Ameca splendens]|uniref:Uncharacterized protein n=1 Tax=Ameca splendens TaxID=208324 RepID=A0ABV0Z286_9TELE
MNRESVNEMISRAETPLFWVGAFTVACLTLWLLYRLLTGFRIWILGNGQLFTPRLGRWAACAPACHSLKPVVTTSPTSLDVRPRFQRLMMTLDVSCAVLPSRLDLICRCSQFRRRW